MAVLPLRYLPDPILKQKAKKISAFDKSVKKLISDMLETMQACNGVGLAAPQVGVPLRIAVISTAEDEKIVLVNPEIIRKVGVREIEERCLSIPGYAGNIKRAEKVTVKARDENGKEIRIKGEEILAQALEHEIDHLNGVLYVDHLESRDKLHKIVLVETTETGDNNP